MAKNKRIITDHIFKAYLNCKYKSYLKLHNHTGHRTDYEILQERLDKKYRLAAQMKLKSHYLKDDVLHISSITLAKLRMGKNVILDTVISGNGLQASYDSLKKCHEGSQVASFSYEPISFCRHKRISRIDKLILAFRSVVLASLQGKTPHRGQLIYGDKFSRSIVRLEPHIKTVGGLIADLKNQITKSANVSLFLNPHCDICEFSNLCKAEATEADHLSLLRGISEKEVSRHNQKGIFTVNQLSYTFRPRKPPKRAKILRDPIILHCNPYPYVKTKSTYTASRTSTSLHTRIILKRLDISWDVNGQIATPQEFIALSGERHGKKTIIPH